MGSSFEVFCCASVLPTLGQVVDVATPFALRLDDPAPRKDQRWTDVVLHGTEEAEVQLQCAMRSAEAGGAAVRHAREALQKQSGYGLWWVSSHLDRMTFVVRGNVQRLPSPAVLALAEALAQMWNGVVFVAGDAFYRDGRPLVRVKG